jgi:hypothetical protein
VSDAAVTLGLSALRHVRIDVTEVPSSWRLSLPRQPWRSSAAERERMSVVDRLDSVFPYRALWTSDWANDDPLRWRILAVGEPLASLAEDLDQGAWVLLFFRHDPGALIGKPVPAAPADAISAARIVRDLGAAAAIWSWYDDNEWLVTISDELA